MKRIILLFLFSATQVYSAILPNNCVELMEQNYKKEIAKSIGLSAMVVSIPFLIGNYKKTALLGRLLKGIRALEDNQKDSKELKTLAKILKTKQEELIRLKPVFNKYSLEAFQHVCSPKNFDIEKLVADMKSFITYERIVSDILNETLSPTLKMIVRDLNIEVKYLFGKKEQFNKKLSSVSMPYGPTMLRSFSSLNRIKSLITELESETVGDEVQSILSNQDILLTKETLFRYKEQLLKYLKSTDGVLIPFNEYINLLMSSLMEFMPIKEISKSLSKNILLSSKHSKTRYLNELKEKLKLATQKDSLNNDSFLQNTLSSEVRQLCQSKSNLARASETISTDIPVLNQGSTNLCGAFAATSLIDVWRYWNTNYTKLPNGKIATSDPYWIGYLGKLNQWAQQIKTSPI